MTKVPPHANLKVQTGASAIEFAIVFPILLLIFYGIICYSLILLHKQTLGLIAGEASRSIIAVTQEAKIQEVIQNAIDGHTWISTRVSPCDGQALYYEKPISDGVLKLCFQADLPSEPALPTIDLSVFGLPKIPPDTENLLRNEVIISWVP
ncbi:MAG: TadE/TadG family type IV pilus assembly protein [Gammaproteobacteria bacterium]